MDPDTSLTSHSDARFRIRLVDKNDNSPSFEGLDSFGRFPASVTEDTNVGTSIVKVTAVDLDGTWPNNQVCVALPTLEKHHRPLYIFFVPRLEEDGVPGIRGCPFVRNWFPDNNSKKI